jgi:uncharacterized membrane protein YeaQ/YmgE (transglycosylase-associated protein family)
MTDETDILMEYCKEEWTHARYLEDQRAAITNIVILIASALTGFLAQKGLGKETVPLTILMTLLGIFGAFTSEKLYELTQLHINRARHWRRRIDGMYPEIDATKLKEQAIVEHAAKYPMLSRMHLHHLWLLLHLGITVTGVIATIVALA